MWVYFQDQSVRSLHKDVEKTSIHIDRSYILSSLQFYQVESFSLSFKLNTQIIHRRLASKVTSSVNAFSCHCNRDFDLVFLWLILVPERSHQIKSQLVKNTFMESTIPKIWSAKAPYDMMILLWPEMTRPNTWGLLICVSG